MQGRWDHFRSVCEHPDATLAYVQRHVSVADLRAMYDGAPGNSFWINVGIYTSTQKYRSFIYKDVFPWIVSLFAQEVQDEDTRSGFPLLWDLVDSAVQVPWQCHLIMVLLDAGMPAPCYLSSRGQHLFEYMTAHVKSSMETDANAFWTMVAKLLDRGVRCDTPSEDNPRLEWIMVMQRSRDKCREACIALLSMHKLRPDLRALVPRDLWRRMARMQWAWHRFDYACH